MTTGSAQRAWLATGLTLAALAAGMTGAQAQNEYGPGASDTEIKLGQTMPYSGPASAYGTIGKAEAAIMKYMNAKKVPMLFVASGAAKFTDPKSFPWTIGYNPSYLTEAHVYAQYIVREKPDAKIAILTQNDDFGRDYVKGLKEGLGSKANMIVAEATYEVTDPTVDSQM